MQEAVAAVVAVRLVLVEPMAPVREVRKPWCWFTGKATVTARLPSGRSASGWAPGRQSLKSPTALTTPAGRPAGRTNVISVPFLLRVRSKMDG
ncbi:hypothetical protein ACFVX6_32565 [Streptomyces sp. NPDC058289]|uniref:hypothetical protein n=1 Tax=Streptomyces sp. NPDC058289 TaxID=3346425 RepID=UPI0036ED3CED